MWAGLRPMTPDNLPILGRKRHRNLFYNTGHGHIGWTMSHGSARHARPTWSPGAQPALAGAWTREARVDGHSRRPIRPRRAALHARRGHRRRAAIGLIVLATDQTMEHEFRQADTPARRRRLPGAAVNDDDITPDTLRAMQPLIAPATELILPGMPLDVVAFGCTSASMTLGEEAVFAEIRSARPELACTTPVTAALAAFRALGARRIGVLTPYSAAVNRTRPRLFRAARPRGRRVRHVRQARRPRGRADLAGVDRRRRSSRLPRSAQAGCGLRLLHQPAPVRARRRDRGPSRHAGHLERPRAGLALPAARRAWTTKCPALGRLFELPLN